MLREKLTWELFCKVKKICLPHVCKRPQFFLSIYLWLYEFYILFSMCYVSIVMITNFYDITLDCFHNCLLWNYNTLLHIIYLCFAWVYFLKFIFVKIQLFFNADLWYCVGMFFFFWRRRRTTLFYFDQMLEFRNCW